MTYKFEYAPVSKEDATKLLNAQKVLMAYATQGLEYLTGLMLEAPDLGEFAKGYEIYMDVTEFTKKLGSAQSVEEAQQLVDQVQKKVQKKVDALMVSSLEAQVDYFKNRSGGDSSDKAAE